MHGEQLGDAADVVRVMMGGKDRSERELFAREVIEHRAGLAWIHDGRMGGVTQRPDVVVLEGFDWNDLERSEHGPAILRAKRGAKV